MIMVQVYIHSIIWTHSFGQNLNSEGYQLSPRNFEKVKTFDFFGDSIFSNMIKWLNLLKKYDLVHMCGRFWFILELPLLPTAFVSTVRIPFSCDEFWTDNMPVRFQVHSQNIAEAKARSKPLIHATYTMQSLNLKGALSSDSGDTWKGFVFSPSVVDLDDQFINWCLVQTDCTTSSSRTSYNRIVSLHLISW